MPVMSLYNTCLRKVSLRLRNGGWKSRRENPFRFLPTDILDDLVTTTLNIQKQYGFRAIDLELLLKSKKLRRFKIHGNDVKQELGFVLTSLTKACQNLEVLILTNLSSFKPDPSKELQELIKNCPNLKHIHSEVDFDLKALRNCRKLRTIKLHFNPKQPWYDFLEDEHGCLRQLDSLELFTICVSTYYEFQSVSPDYIVILLRYCPSLTSLGMLETSRALSQLFRTGVLPRVKLRRCCWGKSKHPISETEWIREAVEYHPCVEELYVTLYCAESVMNLCTLKNLVLLEIFIRNKSDFSPQLYYLFKDIGVNLKYLSLTYSFPVDISIVLQNCQNIEALELRATKYAEFSKTTISLPNLKYLTLNGNEYEDEKRILALFSGCHSLTELFMIETKGFDDATLDKFLRKNSLSNLKTAFLLRCSLTERGFKKFILNSPNLDKIAAGGIFCGMENVHERIVKKILLDTNHKAICDKKIVTLYDRFFSKKRSCYLY